MGFKRTMEKIRRKFKRRKGLLLASIIVLSIVLGMTMWEQEARSNEIESNIDIRSFCPTCKDLAFVSVDNHNYLTLYDGHPLEGKIIRELFKLDMEAMENSLPRDAVDQLLSGIQVADVDEYNSVLSSFSDYALE